MDINEALMLPSREKKGVLISKIDPETLQMITSENVVSVISERERETAIQIHNPNECSSDGKIVQHIPNDHA